MERVWNSSCGCSSLNLASSRRSYRTRIKPSTSGMTGGVITVETRLHPCPKLSSRPLFHLQWQLPRWRP